ncbi:hypothetical protein [Massilia glaciei]|nr:hypothetical protein [Massilia glaciei]
MTYVLAVHGGAGALAGDGWLRTGAPAHTRIFREDESSLKVEP